MPIFRREGEAPSPGSERPGSARSERPAGGGRHGLTLIASGSRVTGEITGSTEVRIDGELDGEVRVDHRVEVGPEGRVQGRIRGRVVRVAGRVAGDLVGSELVELSASSHAEGNISAPRVIISEGAFFKGSVEMGGDRDRSRSRGGSRADAPARGGQ